MFLWLIYKQQCDNLFHYMTFNITRCALTKESHNVIVAKNYYVILEDTHKAVISLSEALLQTLSTLINEQYNQVHLIRQ